MRTFSEPTNTPRIGMLGSCWRGQAHLCFLVLMVGNVNTLLHAPNALETSRQLPRAPQGSLL